MEGYVCIHGHFYQPPRENPWLEAIELQESAHPYHDWNKRITAECYAPNATSRILDGKNLIVQMVNNYAKMSFNFGPTLLAWMEKNAPDVYAAVLEADLESGKRHSGHGSAIAQAYSHMIMPLADRRDKLTQVRWGISDFEHRFGRNPEGMWLPETAVDLETLDILAEEGIRFTILAQHQAKQVRPIGESGWREVGGGKIDPTTAYTLRLPSGRAIALFFYDGAISRSVAFERLLTSGEAFAQRLVSPLSDKRDRPRIIHIATDGESYGHHHQFGEMALAYALNAIESKHLASLTNYGEFLERHPPAFEVEILEDTSWSCTHGLERWRNDCGCNTGAHPGWNQGWRRFLREALDWLRDWVSPVYEDEGKRFLKDPWEARDRYIEVILDPSRESRERFLNSHASRDLSEGEKGTALKLLELQRHAMLMYTSCGWFFDDPSGIETIQIIQYAGRVLQLAHESSGKELESGFLDLLSRAKSNVPGERDGRAIYERYVKTAMADLKKVGAHYAMSSLFQDYEDRAEIYCYRVDQEDYQLSRAGKATLVTGKALFTSEVTWDSALLSFAVLHLGDHNLSCGVRKFMGEEAYRAMVTEVSGAFGSADFPETIRCLDKHFGKSIYSLKSLFRNEQSRILDLILESTLADAEAVYRQLYENLVPMIRFLKDSRSPLPKALYLAAEFVVYVDLHRAFAQEELDVEQIRTVLDSARTAGINLVPDGLEYALRQNLEGMAQRFSTNPADIHLLESLESALAMAADLPFRVNLWTVQNIYYRMLQAPFADQRRKADRGDREAEIWINHFSTLCDRLSIRVP
ncbi:MAG: DUF3536 domain-containing protein [Pseudomonadota bacterium]